MTQQYTNLGPGDEATWPACSGHPNDPRSPEPPEWEHMTREQKLDALVESNSTSELAELYLGAIEHIRELIQYHKGSDNYGIAWYIKHNAIGRTMTLAATWLAAEAERGRSKSDARRALNEATGLRLTAGDVYRWEQGQRSPRHAEVRRYMLLMAVPYLARKRTKRTTVAATVEALL